MIVCVCVFANVCVWAVDAGSWCIVSVTGDIERMKGLYDYRNRCVCVCWWLLVCVCVCVCVCVVCVKREWAVVYMKAGVTV